MWYPGSGVVLSVLIPDLCRVSYFVGVLSEITFLPKAIENKLNKTRPSFKRVY